MAFESAKTAKDQVSKGVELLDQIAGASGLAVDASADSYYAQDVLVQRLGGVKQALIDLRNTLDSTASSADETNFAINYASCGERPTS